MLSDFPELGPVALSGPSVGNGDGPWVLLFERFAKPEEVDGMLAAAENQGFRRSTETGPANARGEVEKIVSKSRTSENAWCTGRCESDTHVQSLTARTGNGGSARQLRATPSVAVRGGSILPTASRC